MVSHHTLWVFLVLCIGLTSSNKRDIVALEEQGKKDNTTKVTVSLMVWTTKEFEESFNNKNEMMELINKNIDEANTAFDNSKIPVKVVLHDEVKRHPYLSENKEAKEQWQNKESLQLVDFEYSMKQAELLNCADAALFLVNSWGKGGGVANINRAKSCNTFSMIQKHSLAKIKNYFLAHELAHNFGANHDPKQMKDGEEFTALIYNQGHHIQPPGKPGYTTIMGYEIPGHEQRVAYFSNPDVIYPGTGKPTGVHGVSNNAKIISENRFLMASCGEEEPNGQCYDCNIHPDIDYCTTCCENVKFQSNVKTPFAGTYMRYKETPTSNNRNVYKHQTENYCLFYAIDVWLFKECNKIGETTGVIRSIRTSNSCVHSEKLDWIINGRIDPSMEVSCTQ